MHSLGKSATTGIDEVGRGALFGPVVAAAVVLPQESEAALAALGVKDSKRLTARQREELVVPIQEHADCFALGMASVREIDRINILQASLLAMKRAVEQLTDPPTLCLVDGQQKIPDLGIPQQTIVKGDQVCLAIAAASILAKVWRDTLIVRLDKRYPGYDLAANKGYGSDLHRAAIARLGLTSQHRKSFKISYQRG